MLYKIVILEVVDMLHIWGRYIYADHIASPPYKPGAYPNHPLYII